MIGRPASESAVTWWLTGQTALFGVVAALLGIVANAMFLDAFGSQWLPVTYVLIGVAGLVLSGGIARSARSVELMRLAITVLGVAAVAIALSWLVALGGDGAWVSVPLLVLFPILIQLGFVFVGGQAGRLLDIGGIKARFPRIAAGFPVGAVVGGLLGGQLVALTGRTEDLLLATAIAQAAFTGLVWATARRFPAQLLAPTHAPAPSVSPDPSLRDRRRLFGHPFVLLILAYQVLSAVGSQLADFLVLDRAQASFPEPAELAGFLAGYTAIMNIVSIAFLVLLAGPLLQRFGLRLGVTANPLVLTLFALGMGVADAFAGATSMALLVTVSAARIADIALTDGTTRTSINAMYQALPEHLRLAAQTTVEGIGVPVAIAISGVIILVLGALPAALTTTIVVTTLTCLVWTVVALRLYRRYGPALIDALRRPRLLDPGAGIETVSGDEAAARRLILEGDLRTGRLGVDLLVSMGSPAIAVELGRLAEEARPEVRTGALVALAAGGDESARRRLWDDARVAAASPDAGIRHRAALALEVLGPADRSAMAALLSDTDAAVRAAAIDAVQAGDDWAVEPVIASLDDTATLTAAASAVGRLGDAVLPAVDTRLAAATMPVPPLVSRLVRALDTRTPARDAVLCRHIGHPDRDLGAAVIERLVAPDPAGPEVARALDEQLVSDGQHAIRVLGALEALDTDAAPGPEVAPLRSALADELALLRRRVLAGRVARHGSTILGPVMTALVTAGPHVALALEALEVTLSPEEAKLVLPLARPDATPAERLRAFTAAPSVDEPAPPADLAGWLRDIVEDRQATWRSSWATACALSVSRTRGLLRGIDTSRARAVADPAIDELLDVAGPSGGSMDPSAAPVG